MKIKMREENGGYNTIVTLCDIKPTGELEPTLSISYAGDINIGPSRQEKQTRFLLEQQLPPHKQSEIRKLFGDAHDNAASANAQKAMFEKFVEVFENKLAQPATAQTVPSNETPASPIYFYQKLDKHNRDGTGEVFAAKFSHLIATPTLFQVTVYSAEDKKLCRICGEKKDEAAVVKAVQETIMDLSKKAAFDFNDILKQSKPRGGEDGPGGMN